MKDLKTLKFFSPHIFMRTKKSLQVTTEVALISDAEAYISDVCFTLFTRESVEREKEG